MSSATVVLGVDAENGGPVVLPQTARLMGTYLIGANGTGKTTLIENLIVQDIAQGLGLCVLDPHGDLIEAVLRRGVAGREEEMIFWDLGDDERPFGLNLFACDDPADEHVVGRTAEELVQVFKKVWGEGEEASWGPRLEDLLRNVAVTLISSPGMTLLEIPRLLADRSFRETLVTQVRSPAVADFWRYEYDPETDKEQREHRSSTLNKVRSFLINPIVRSIVGQSQSTLAIPEIMAESQVLLVKLALGRIGALPVSLLGSVLVAQLFNAAMARVATSHRPQFNLYLDEYHRFATPAVSELLTEVRKFGVATTIAHQARYQLDAANRGASMQSGNLIVFRVSGTDAEELANAFDATPPPPEIIGYKPLQVICPEPVEFLVRNGHRHWKVQEFATSLLGALVNGTRDMTNTQTWCRNFRGETFCTPRRHLLTGLAAMDRYFLAMMERRIRGDHSPEQVEHIIDITIPLMAWLFITNYDWTDPDSAYSVRPRLRRALAQKEIDWEPLVSFAVGLERLRHTPGTPYEIPERLRDVWQAGLRMWFDFLFDVGQLLQEDPILVNTGQHEPIYGPPRSYGDVQAQIANELANLPRYTARAKVLGAEHTVRTLPSSVGLGTPLGATLRTEIETITERSRLAFGTPREAIAAEIERRQQVRVIDERVREAELPPSQAPTRPRWETI